MEERPASRTVTAYARGLYLAQVFQLAVAGIAVLAVIIGGYMVSRQAKELVTLEAARTEAEEQLETARAESGKRLEFNDRLISLGSLIAGIDPSDPSGYSTGLTALEALQADFSADLATASWQEASLRLSTLRVNLLEASQQYDLAVGAQEQLLAAQGAGAPAAALVRLATLNCKQGDYGAAQTVLSDRLAGTDPGEFNDSAFQDACAGRIALPVPPPAAPIPVEAEMPMAGDIEKGLDDILMPGRGAPAPSRGPASEVAPPPAAASEITKVFLHIRQEGQRASAAKVAAGVCAAGYTMPGIELVAEPRPYPQTPRVIYYYADQSAAAGEVAGLISSIAYADDLAGWDISYDLRLYRAEGLPRDRVEIWFPEGTELTTETADQRFRCAP